MLRLLLLTLPSAPKITPLDAGNNRGGAELKPPVRADLRSEGVRVLKQGGPTKADLLILDLGHGQLVVKDFARKKWWVRLAGRLQVARECRAYRWLGPMPCLPRLAGRVDAHALAIEWIDADELAVSPHRVERGVEFLERLREVVRRLHGTGLVHLDLRGRENVLVDRRGTIFVLDLASAIWFRPGGLAHKLFFPSFSMADEAALLKWKRLLEVGPYSEAEQAFLKRFRMWRAMWPFNRKGTNRRKRRG
jgi:hypothetical protein